MGKTSFSGAATNQKKTKTGKRVPLNNRVGHFAGVPPKALEEGDPNEQPPTSFADGGLEASEATHMRLVCLA